MAAFALSSRLWVTDLRTGATRELPATGAVIDPRPDPTGAWVAYAGDRVAARRAGRRLRCPRAGRAEHDDVAWGVAEFVASEEMDRYRGYWWSPDGTAVLAARVDETPVQRWHIADPANPATTPVTVAYPAAGTANATVSLHLLGLDGSRVDVAWDDAAFPYVITAHWSEHGDPLVLVMTRDQRDAQVLAIDRSTGATRVLHVQHDETWLDVVGGVPAWLPDGRLVTVVDTDDVRRLVLGEAVVDLGGAQVSHVLAVGADGVLVAGTDEPTEAHLWQVSPDGDRRRG